MDTFTVSVRLKFLLSIFLLKLNYPLEVLNGLLSKGAIPLYTLNDMDPMFFKSVFFLVLVFWQWLMLELVQRGRLMEGWLLHLPSLWAASSRAQHLFLVGTQTHTTCVYTWLATGINMEKRTLGEAQTAQVA